jgi:hypothetical protein
MMAKTSNAANEPDGSMTQLYISSFVPVLALIRYRLCTGDGPFKISLFRIFHGPF